MMRSSSQILGGEKNNKVTSQSCIGWEEIEMKDTLVHHCHLGPTVRMRSFNDGVHKGHGIILSSTKVHSSTSLPPKGHSNHLFQKKKMGGVFQRYASFVRGKVNHGKLHMSLKMLHVVDKDMHRILRDTLLLVCGILSMTIWGSEGWKAQSEVLLKRR